jgi:hypothetical protein
VLFGHISAEIAHDMLHQQIPPRQSPRTYIQGATSRVSSDEGFHIPVKGRILKPDPPVLVSTYSVRVQASPCLGQPPALSGLH